MADKISAEQAMKDAGVTMEDCVFETTGTWGVPACCSEGCTVEPDGHCSHGYPSVMLELL